MRYLSGALVLAHVIFGVACSDEETTATGGGGGGPSTVGGQGGNGGNGNGGLGGEGVGGGGVFASSLTWGPFTVEFDRSVEVGVFSRDGFEGDPWVRLPPGESLTITAITAANPVGAMLNPSDPENPGFHPAMGSNASSLATELPLTLTGDGNIDSLVVGQHHPNSEPVSFGNISSLIERYMILTILPVAPARGGNGVLRPGANGARESKRMWDLNELPLDTFVTSRALAPLAPAQEIYDTICRASDYDYFYNISNGQNLQGRYNSGGVTYGAYKAAKRTALLHHATHSSVPAADRRRYLACLLQQGVDVYQNVRFGGMRYREGGGQGHGRWLPLAVFAALTGDSEIKDFAASAATPRPDPNAAREAFEEFDHYYYSTAMVNGSPINRVLYGDAEAYGWTYDCLLHGTCANPPQATYWSTKDSHDVIDGGAFGGAYFSTIETALAIAVDAAVVLPSVEPLVDARMVARVESFAMNGFRTLPDPFAAERPLQGQYNGTRNYDGQLDPVLINAFLSRVGASPLP